MQHVDNDITAIGRGAVTFLDLILTIDGSMDGLEWDSTERNAYWYSHGCFLKNWEGSLLLFFAHFSILSTYVGHCWNQLL